MHISKADLIKGSNRYGALIFEQNAIYNHQSIPGTGPLIEVTGAGGNGGGNGTGGGGGGGYAAGIYTLTPNTDYTITVGQNSGNRTSSFSSLLSASGGTNATFAPGTDGYSAGGNGGSGSNGTLANHQGGHGGKGAGYNDCSHRSEYINPATPAQKYGAGGGGGNGNGSPATNGADGVVIIRFCSIDFEVIQTGYVLEAKTESGTLQWVRISEDSTISILAGETSRSYTVLATGSYALYISNGTCSGYSTIFHQEVVTANDISLSADKIRIYPNPDSDYIVVDADNMDLETVRILSLNGIE